MTGFDMIIPLTLGPIVADMILLSKVTFFRGVMALVMLISLHSLVSWLSVRSARFRRMVKREPSLLLYRGQFMREAMWRERVTEEEVRVAIRASGFAVVEKVEAVVLEADGTFNVVGPSTEQVSTSLNNVYGYEFRELRT